LGKLTIFSVTAAVALAVTAATPSSGQEPGMTMTSELRMIPKKAGTKAHPRGVRIFGSLGFAGHEDDTRPVIAGGRVLLPRGIVYNGGRYPRCRKRTLRREGRAGCPERSIVGANRGARADVSPVYPEPDITFVNGGARLIWAYVVYYHPTLIKEPVPIHVRKLRTRRWGYELSFTWPRILQLAVGVPIKAPAAIRLDIGGRKNAPRYLETHGGCPPKGFLPYSASFDFLFPDGTRSTSGDRGRLACL
jgi:hypothetical protein